MRITSLIISAIALGSCPAVPRLAGASPRCVPIVQLAGEAAIAVPLRARLSARGVPVSGDSACGKVTVVVTRGADRALSLIIIDADGRTIERRAEDVELGATTIESWARGDLAAPLLAGRGGRTRPAPAIDSEQPPSVDGDNRATTARARRGPELAAAVLGGLGGDGSLWTGVGASGCVRIGPVCAGGFARYATDTADRGDAARLDSRRSALELGVTAGLPLRNGRLELRPGLGLAQTTVFARELALDDADFSDAVALRMLAELDATLALSRGLGLRLALSYGFAPAARTQLGDDDDDPSQTEDDRPMAGVTSHQGWLSVGLVYGGP